MVKLQFEFAIIPANDPKTNVYAITSITTEEGKCYAIPEEYRVISHHKEIMQTETFGKIKNCLKKRHQSRKVWMKVDGDLKDAYIDEDGNMQFADLFLEEIPQKQTTEKNDSLQQILEKLIEATDVGKKQQDLKRISEKFIIEKFTSKNSNASQWMETFEKECDRFSVTQDESKIEVLRFFLEKSCLDWYSAMTTKLTVNSEWTVWKRKFLETFVNKGWNMITYAYAFKYKEGQLIDYAMKKEKLILDINKSTDTQTIIDHIAIGLPEFVLNRINRDDLKDSTDLFNEIKKYEGLMYKKNFTKVKEHKPDFKKRTKEKKPCKTCENLGKGSRYHPEEACWYKTKNTEQEKKEKIRNVNNNSILEVDLNTDEKN